MVRAGFVSVVVAGLALGSVAHAQERQEQHGRKWKPLPDLAHIVVTVEKGYNGQPLPNAAVIFHATRGGENDGNLEVKTDPDGRAVLDLIEVGSHVTLQIIAPGFATYASEFDADAPNKEMLVKLIRPRAQVSVYQDNDGKAAKDKPGVQEHIVPKKTPAKPSTTTPPPVTSTTPATATPSEPQK